MDNQESVDFDFFETPRNDDISSSPTHTQSAGKPPIARKPTRSGNDNTGDDSDDSLTSDSDSEDQVKRPYVKPRKTTPGENNRSPEKVRGLSGSESSSAYSNSDYSSDSDIEEETVPRKKERIQINIPKVNAWGSETRYKDDGKFERERKSYESSSHESKHVNKSGKSAHETKKKYSDSSDSDYSPERYHEKSRSANKRVQSAKSGGKKQVTRKTLKSTSSSYSNNSDITDVSSLESPEASPRGRRKSNGREEKENEHRVQYKDSLVSEQEPNIKLESDKIDLSILMRCMADIDKEKQQRIKSNSRRVMFAPNEKAKQNYSFSMDRAKTIEKENQRLLKQIMQHIHTEGKPRSSESRMMVSHKTVQPPVQRLTPSAVNRQREQRRIESENMHILHRLRTVKASPGMAKYDQIKEFERTASYGIPVKAVIVPGQKMPQTMRRQELHSSLGFSQRQRPSSAKSNTSVPGRRSRPSSAKSSASISSNASMRSTASKRSTTSVRSNASIRSGLLRKMSDGKVDNRPQWDDRFTVT